MNFWLLAMKILRLKMVVMMMRVMRLMKGARRREVTKRRNERWTQHPEKERKTQQEIPISTLKAKSMMAQFLQSLPLLEMQLLVADESDILLKTMKMSDIAMLEF